MLHAARLAHTGHRPRVPRQEVGRAAGRRAGAGVPAPGAASAGSARSTSSTRTTASAPRPVTRAGARRRAVVAGIEDRGRGRLYQAEPRRGGQRDGSGRRGGDPGQDRGHGRHGALHRAEPVFSRGGQRLVAGGWQSLAAYDVCVANLAPDLERRPEPVAGGPPRDAAPVDGSRPRRSRAPARIRSRTATASPSRSGCSSSSSRARRRAGRSATMRSGCRPRIRTWRTRSRPAASCGSPTAPARRSTST